MQNAHSVKHDVLDESGEFLEHTEDTEDVKDVEDVQDAENLEHQEYPEYSGYSGQFEHSEHHESFQDFENNKNEEFHNNNSKRIIPPEYNDQEYDSMTKEQKINVIFNNIYMFLAFASIFGLILQIILG